MTVKAAKETILGMKSIIAGTFNAFHMKLNFEYKWSFRTNTFVLV